MRVCGMRTGITVDVKAADRARLEAIVADRNSPQKHVWRARIVLLIADGLATNEIMRQTAKSKTCLWRWQERFMQTGVEGLLHDRTRPSRVPPLPPAIGERVVALTQSDPPGETTHWTAAAMAGLVRISVSSVQRISFARGPAAPRTAVQTLARPRIHSQAAGHRRAVYRPVGARDAAQRR
jgi:homeodomain-containing protein